MGTAATFVWQIYPQAENAHFVKLDAFLSRFLGEFKDSEAVSSLLKKESGTLEAPGKPEES